MFGPLLSWWDFSGVGSCASTPVTPTAWTTVPTHGEVGNGASLTSAASPTGSFGGVCAHVLELTQGGTRTDESPAFVVEDGNYVCARWPGDAYLFALRFRARLTAPR